MNGTHPFQNSPRCTATSKRTKRACQAPAVSGWSVCRFHGAGGGAPKGKRNGLELTWKAILAGQGGGAPGGGLDA